MQEDFTPVARNTASGAPPHTSYPVRAGPAFRPEVPQGSAARMSDSMMGIVMDACNQIQQPPQIEGAFFLQDAKPEEEETKDGLRSCPPSDHRTQLDAQVVTDDIHMNELRLLPYPGFCNPVFRMSILGEVCIFMVDTGSSCNLAFLTLTKKFPFVTLLPN